MWLFEDDTPVPPANYDAIPVALFACTPSATVRTIESGVTTPYSAIQERLTAFYMAGDWFEGSDINYTLYTGPIATRTTVEKQSMYVGVITVTGE